MKSAILEVDLIDNSALEGIFGEGKVVAAPQEGVQLSRPEPSLTHGFGLGEVVPLTLEYLRHAPVDFLHAAVAAWLFEILKNRARRVTYKGRAYRVTQEDFERILKQIEREDANSSAK